jgi:hypothetical protein
MTGVVPACAAFIDYQRTAPPYVPISQTRHKSALATGKGREARDEMVWLS